MQTAFDDWAAEHQARLVSYAYLVCHDREEARDITQDVLLVLLRRWDTLTGDPLAYARRSITNAAIDRWRRHGRHVVHTPPRDDHPTAEPGPDEANRCTDSALAWQLCRELPPQQRAVVVLRYWADLPHDDIAEVLGIPASTARSHLKRALAALAPRLTQEDLT
ncbi:RNA polymerase sigma factor [Propionibacteriaceae bacterium G1746]|uniref:RNA polymerase sigma factor n=1 Tax=Aestuariimicrobium sp. G57 TaxID=3418485 RepID=UPI003C17B129